MTTPSVCRKKERAIWKIFFLPMVCFILSFVLLRRDMGIEARNVSRRRFISKEGQPLRHFKNLQTIENKGPKKILLWTKFFRSMDWEQHVKKTLNEYDCECQVTSNRNEVESADAVIFHLLDTWVWESVPKDRPPHQVWVLFNMESPIFVYDIGINLSSWKFMFNWTMSYRRNSTVYAPYGSYRMLSETEKYKQVEIFKAREIRREKYKMAYAVVSDCFDDSGRFQILHELKHHLPLDIYGACGNLSCPLELCDIKIKPYMFKVSFENANCRDYVTEKFWDALEAEAIPVVNWKEKQVIKNVPPNSYINIYDFENFSQLTSYLKKVSENKTLFDSFHAWKKEYKTINNLWAPFCTLCNMLHQEKRKVRIVDDPVAWIKDDTCRTWSIPNVIRRHFNYWAFRFGWQSSTKYSHGLKR